jgi:hypothetical protein
LPRTGLDDIAWLHNVINDPRGRQIFLNTIGEATGMNALRIAVGRNKLEIDKPLVESRSTARYRQRRPHAVADHGGL